MRMIGKDMLGIAGAHYLTQLDQLAASNTRGETLKHLKRAQKASRDLADSLKHVMVDRAASSAKRTNFQQRSGASCHPCAAWELRSALRGKASQANVSLG